MAELDHLSERSQDLQEGPAPVDRATGSGPSPATIQAAGASATERITDGDVAAGAESVVPPGVAQSLATQLSQLENVAGMLGQRRTKLILELINTAATEGVSSPHAQTLIFQLVTVGAESIADSMVPVWRGAQKLGQSVMGEDGEGRHMSFGERILNGIKGVFAILIDVHSLGLARGAASVLGKISKVRSAAEHLETATRVTPLLGDALKNPNDPVLFARFLEVMQQPTIAGGLQSTIEQKITDTLDGKAAPPTEAPLASLATGPTSPTEHGGPN